MVAPTLFPFLVLVYGFTWRQASAETCGAGRYCSGENWAGTNECSDCPAGSYCPGQSDDRWALNCWKVFLRDGTRILYYMLGRKVSEQYGTSVGATSSDTCRGCPDEGQASIAGSTECYDKPLPLFVFYDGECDEQKAYNGNYDVMGITASGRYYYKKKDEERFIYWDPYCDGAYSTPLWVFDDSEPSLTEEGDLHEDQDCIFEGHIESVQIFPPIGENIWYTQCGDEPYMNLPITISTTCPEGEEPTTSGELKCVPCPSGSYSGASASLCVPCEAGKHLISSTTLVEAEACASCPDGQISWEGSEFCVTPTHTWDFRGCNTGEEVGDSSEGSSLVATPLVATPMNEATCSADGISLDGSNDFINITPWKWGGTVSFEVYVKYNSFNNWSRIFDFGNGENSDNVVLSNEGTKSTVAWEVRQESTNKDLLTSNFDSSTWTHFVVTVSGTNMTVYKNGVLVETQTDGHEPNVLTRTQHWLGRSAWFSNGYFDGTIAYVKIWHREELQQLDVTDLYAPYNTAHHFWDFRGCTTGSPVTDSIAKDLVATPKNGAACKPDGISLDGNNDHVDIDDWEWGDSTSIEVYIKYDAFNSNSPVFDFGKGQENDNVFLWNSGATSSIEWGIFRGSTCKYIGEGNFESYTWAHLVLTASGTSMKMYKNGALVRSKADGHEPNVLTRTRHWLGRSTHEQGNDFDGTIAYVKVWHGVELQQSDVTDLYAPHNTAHHFWDFRGCSTGSVTDSIAGDLVATRNGASCSAGGISFDGSDDHVGISEWEWGGTTSFEIYVKYNSFKENSRVFDFGKDDDDDENVYLSNHEDTSKIHLRVYVEENMFGWDTYSSLKTSYFDSYTWAHVIVTVSGAGGSKGATKMYKNENTNHFDGTIAYIKVWHGVELQQSDVTNLYAPLNTAHHMWDFRGCTTGSPVIDSIAKYLKALPQNGPSCSADGISLDGKNDYVSINNWEWGGVVSFEMYIQQNERSDLDPKYILDFRGEYFQSVRLYSSAYNTGESKLNLSINGGYLATSDLGIYAWTQVVVTSNGGDMKIYVNGGLEKTISNGKTLPIRTSTNNFLGRAYNSDSTWDKFGGTIAYLKIWHGVELTESDVSSSYRCPAGEFGNLIAGCEICPTGQYSVYPNTRTCMKCAGGKSTIESNSTYHHDEPSDCILCNLGEYSYEGEACITCKAGEYTGSVLEPCKICDAGKYSAESSPQCTNCPAGKYNADRATSRTYHTPNSCHACPVGKFLEDAGIIAEEHDDSTDCKSCVEDTYSDNEEDGAASCTPCEVGKNSPTGSKVCSSCPFGFDCRNGNPTACPAGRYSNGYTQETDAPCQLCEKGFSCPGSTKENVCPAGSHAPEQALEECLACPKGKYQGDAGQDKCLGCLAGYFCPERTVHPIPCGSVALFCPPNSTIVQAVGVGNYTTGATETTREGEAICEAGFACVGGEKKNCDGAGEYSQPGSGFWTYTDTGGVGIEACFSCKEGFFSADPGSSTCYTCEPGKYTNVDQTGCLLCPAGQISGVAASSCSECEIGKYAEGKGNAWCKFCDDDEALIGSVTVGKGTTSSSGCICPAGDYVNQGDGENFCKNVPEGVKMNVEAMTVVNLNVSRGFWRTDNSSYDVLQCLAPEHCIGGSDPERQCKEGHTGPLCAVCVDGYASTGSGMFLKCSSCTNGDPVTTITIWIFAFIFIIFLMIGISLFYFSKIKDRESLVSNSTVFHSKVDKFLEFYVQARPYAKIMLSYWQVDYSIYCASDEHLMYELYAKVCILIYPMGIPLMYIWLLRRARKCLDPGQKHREGRYGIDEGMRRAIEERERREEDDPQIRSLAFLYDSYEPKFYWFEVVETLRKLMLSGGLVLLGPGTVSQVIISIFICLASIRIFSGCEPYIEYKVDVFMEMSQWQIFFVMFAALLIRVDDMLGEAGTKLKKKKIFDAILLATQCLAPAVLILMILFKGKDIVVKLVTKISKSRSNSKNKNENESGVEGGGTQLTEFKGNVVISGRQNSQFEVDNPLASSEKLRKATMKVDSKNGLLAVAKT
ncbi:hypothetical protein TrLO_g61 [Triparma laevis f. longispina]|uniref:Tyrosine-protein kinase ephrin type A/B receptor-like domain-containing protein n=1 Tax=Triparma laevis f. longispina TaxID=1714387 RepID=A0A9W7C5C3_9STRA|nr:hypothetical protein TrLO_g61 [Triparma laevis f. longispina]